MHTYPFVTDAKTLSQLTSAIIALACVAFLPPPKAFGVTPAPDGGYPGGNTAEGTNALHSLTTGSYNMAAGVNALFSNTTGSFNTANGSQALFSNNSNYNTATGVNALYRNTTGWYNTADGAQALFNNHGFYNTAVGVNALYGNTTGSGNTASGFQTLFHNTTGSVNTAYGDGALLNNTTSSSNTAIGWQALANSTGGGNTALGAVAGDNVTTASNVICIGALGQNVSNSCFIDSVYGVTTAQNDAIPVVITSSRQLGTVSSSRRFKEEIRPIDKASEAILALKPVRFHYKSDKQSRPQFGLIAEEVAEVNPDLVVRDNSGEIYTVRYDAVNAMLLNEFLKERRRMQEVEKDLRATVAKQQKQIEALTTGLQKNSDRVELRKPLPQLVLTNQ